MIKCYKFHIQQADIFHDGYIEAKNKKEASLRLFDIHGLDMDAPDVLELKQENPKYTKDYDYLIKYPLFLLIDKNETPVAMQRQTKHKL